MFTDPQLIEIDRKVRAGVRIGSEEARKLFCTADILGLGAIANWIKEQKTGNRVSYVVNRQINPTNICVLACKFCAPDFDR